MDNRDSEHLTLRVKKGWKIYQVITGILMIFALGFLVFQMLDFVDYVDTEGFIFISLMVLLCCVGLYLIFYSFKHHIEFTDSGMIRYGIFNKKEFPYEDISKIIFSDSYWKVSPTIKLIGDSNAIHIDFKYDKDEKEKVIRFLQSIIDGEEKPEIILD